MIAHMPTALAGVFSSGAFGYVFDYILWCAVYVSLIIHAYCFFRLFPRKRFPKIGLIIGNGLVFLCMLGTVALATESYLRFVAVSTDAFGASLPARRWFALHTNLNSMGCRDSEWTLKKPSGVRRVAFVGDSYTYGWGIDRMANRFTNIIQTHFDARSSQTLQVLNVAKPGWGTSDEIRPIQDMIDRFGVDEVVLCYVTNDIEPLIPVDDAFNPTRPPDYQFVNMDSSPLLDYLYRRIYVPFIPTVRHYHDWLADAFADEHIWRAHVSELTEIVEYCRAHQVTLRVALFPLLITSGDTYDAEVIHRKLSFLFRELGVPVVDLLDVVRATGRKPHEFVVNSLDAHPNEEAHLLFAETLWITWYADSGNGDSGG